MNNLEPITLSDEAANLIERLAWRIAEYKGGRVTPADLLPFVPVSMDVICHALDAMAEDKEAVRAGIENNIRFTEFPALVKQAGEAPSDEDEPAKDGPAPLLLTEPQVMNVARDVIQPRVYEVFLNELAGIADKNAWPARAVYEHEIVYLTAGRSGPFRAEELAARSRYTLRRMRQKLHAMHEASFICEEFSSSDAAMVYFIPQVCYPRRYFQANVKQIEQHPASLMEEVEMKVTRIFFTLGAMLVAVFILALLHFPFPLLMLGFLILSPIVAIKIWRHRSKPPE